jgi:hypothetical protein
MTSKALVPRSVLARTNRRARRRVLRRRIALVSLALALVSLVGGFLAVCLAPVAVR